MTGLFFLSGALQIWKGTRLFDMEAKIIELLTPFTANITKELETRGSGPHGDRTSVFG